MTFIPFYMTVKVVFGQLPVPVLDTLSQMAHGKYGIMMEHKKECIINGNALLSYLMAKVVFGWEETDLNT